MVLVTIDDFVISFDKFSYNHKENLQIGAYVLTHFHTDHTSGLKAWSKSASASSNHPILYCHIITRQFILQYFSEQSIEIGSWFEKYVIGVDYKIPLYLSGTQSQKIKLTFLDANHCPGSIMIYMLSCKSSRRILYTGDFRYNEKMHARDTEYVDELFLDSSFLLPEYKVFPSKEQILLDLLKLLKECKNITDVIGRVTRDEPVIIEVDTSVLGKEWMLSELSDHFKTPIVIDPVKYIHHKRLTLIPEISGKLSVAPLSKISESVSKTQFLLRPGPVDLDVEKQANIEISLSTLGFYQPDTIDALSTSIVNKVHSRLVQVSMLYGIHSSFDELVEFIHHMSPIPSLITLLSKPIGYDNLFKKMNSNFDTSRPIDFGNVEQLNIWFKNNLLKDLSKCSSLTIVS